jgi:hypothetical protein
MSSLSFFYRFLGPAGLRADRFGVVFLALGAGVAGSSGFSYGGYSVKRAVNRGSLGVFLPAGLPPG